MSNSAVFFCATVLFASAFGASLQNSDVADTGRWIHDANSRIEQRLHEVREQIDILDRNNEGANSQIIEFFKRNVTNRYREGIEIITRTMRGRFERSKCKHYFDEYETFTHEVIDSLDMCIPEAAFPVLESLKKAVREAHDEQERISNLTKVDDTVDSGVARVIGNVEEAFKQYVQLSDGSMIQRAVHSKTPYDAFLKKEDEVFNTFLNCELKKHK